MHIILPVDVTSHPLWQNAEHLKLYLYLLSRASRIECRMPIDGITRTVERGDVVTSLQRIADDCQTSVKAVRTFLNRAGTLNLVGTKQARRATWLRVENYDTCVSEGTTWGTKGATLDIYHSAHARVREGSEYKPRTPAETQELRFEVADKRKPDLDDVIAYAPYLNATRENAEDYWRTFESRGWVTGSDGMPIVKWKPHFEQWLRYRQRKDASKPKGRTL